MDRGLMEMIGKTPEELDGMTLAEIAVACIDPSKPEGHDTTEAELVAYAHWWQSLTPEEKLWAEA
jgi:hypothetical protein